MPTTLLRLPRARPVVTLSGCLGLLFAITLLAGPAHAEVYKYKDKNGVVHYSDNVADQNTQAQKLAIPKPPPVDYDAPQARENWQELEAAADARLRQQKRDQESARARDALAAQRCAWASHAYDAATNAPARSHIDPLSGRSSNNFAERSARIEAAERDMRAACGR